MFSVDQLCSVKLAPNVPPVVQNLAVGTRLNQFWEIWENLVVQMLKEGYTLPFQNRPNLTRKPTIVNCYVNPHRNSYPLEALHQLTNKNAIELVTNQESLGFYNRLFLVPKSNNKWRPILDLSNLNKFLKIEKFKMETAETIRTSLQKGEWVTSIDFKDAYFHIPIQNTLVTLCQDLGWLVNFEKSELEPKQVFDFVGYQFDLQEGRVRPTLQRWQTLRAKIRNLLAGPTCPVRCLMSLTGLLTATEKQVHLGRLHMWPIQWHLKQNWRIPVTRKGDTSSQVPPPTLKVVAGGKQCAPRSTITSNKTCSADFYRCIKRRVGCSLKRMYCKGILVSTRKQAAHKLSVTKSSISSFKRITGSLFKPNSACSHRQHHCGFIHKQGRRHEVGPSLCPTMEDTDLVHQESSNS